MWEKFNPWNPKAYSKWYHYVWLMPILTVALAYVWFENRVYEMFRK